MGNASDEQSIEFIRLREVKRLTSLSTTTIYKMANEGTFPKQVKLGAKAVAWIKAEVREWGREQVDRSRSHTDSPVPRDQQPISN
ncbi:hypothetical protein C4K30_0376 [Pseudomonas chlororaphis subsp. piscium]|nr:hypothetical protein C4K30_0376 [Pseudomonas chlororaphis subsp. piscium]